MRVKWCKLKNFRNYEELFVEFHHGMNLISGKNGQGKTNLVEAVMLNSLTKSPRTSRDDDMKREGTEHTEAEICVKRSFGDVNVKCVFDGNKKKFFINSNEVKKLSEVFGNLVAVYFSPNDLKIVSGGPSERRDFVDMDISEISGSYYNLTQKYERVLFQRNRLLKMVHDKSLLKEQIAVWNEQLAHLAGLIIKTRKNFIQKLQIPANETMKFMSKGSEELTMTYVGVKGESAAEIESEILKSLETNFERDMELGYTSVGPHRDDVRFELDGRDAKIFASQGQQRSIVLALKIAEMQVFENEIGEKPVLVLDDVFSELDSSRQRKMYENLKGMQVLMTGTAFKFKPDEEYLSLTVKEAVVKSKKIDAKIN